MAGDQSGKEGKAKVGNTKEADKSALASRDAGKEVVEKQTGEETLAKQPADEKRDAVAPAVAPALDLPQLAKKQRQLVEADQPIEVELSLEQANKQLSATVESRGVQVAQQQVEPIYERYLKDGQALEQRATVTLNVPKEVVGNVDVTFYDRVANTVVLKRELYRAPARGLRFELLNPKERYDPGELVRLQFKVVNEHGEAASATNIVRVWNEDFVADDRSQLVMLDDAVWKSESRAEQAGEGQAGEGEVLGQFGRSETVVEEGLALGGAGSRWRRSRSGEADPEPLSGLAAEATTNRFAQSDAQAPVAELKKAEDSSSGCADCFNNRWISRSRFSASRCSTKPVASGIRACRARQWAAACTCGREPCGCAFGHAGGNARRFRRAGRRHADVRLGARRLFRGPSPCADRQQRGRRSIGNWRRSSPSTTGLQPPGGRCSAACSSPAASSRWPSWDSSLSCSRRFAGPAER